MQNVMADRAVSVSELKKNPSAVMSGAHGGAVAVLNHNRVMAYMVPTDVYEAMMERLDDMDLALSAASLRSAVYSGMTNFWRPTDSKNASSCGRTARLPAWMAAR